MTIDGEATEQEAILAAYSQVRQRFGRDDIPQDIVEQWAAAVRARQPKQARLF